MPALVARLWPGPRRHLESGVTRSDRCPGMGLTSTPPPLAYRQAAPVGVKLRPVGHVAGTPLDLGRRCVRVRDALPGQVAPRLDGHGSEHRRSMPESRNCRIRCRNSLGDTGSEQATAAVTPAPCHTHVTGAGMEAVMAMDRVPLGGLGRIRRRPDDELVLDMLRGRGAVSVTVGAGTPTLWERASWWRRRRRLSRRCRLSRRYGVIATREQGRWYLHEPRPD